MRNPAAAGRASTSSARKNTPPTDQAQGRRDTFPGSVLPARVIGDRRLQAAHWHVLAAVAFRDRMGKNGQGCWASYAKLAEDTNYDLSTVAKAISDMVEWGIIFRSRNTKAKDRRTRELRVIYLESQVAEWAGKNSNHWPTRHRDLVESGENVAEAPKSPRSWTDWPESDQLGDEINGAHAIDLAEIDGAHAILNKISLSESKKNSGEPASPDGAACDEDGQSGESRKETAAFLRKVEAALKAAEHRPLTKGERQYFAHQMRQCAETADAILYGTRHEDLDPADQNLGFQAQRLAEEIADRVEGTAA